MSGYSNTNSEKDLHAYVELSTNKADVNSEISDVTLSIFDKKKIGNIVEIGGSESAVKELEIEKTDFSAQERNFHNVHMDKLGSDEDKMTGELQETMSRKLKLKETQMLLKPSHSLESLDDIDRILKEQNKKICQLQEQMGKLSRRIDESSCVLPTRYQNASKPDIVYLCFRCKDGFEIRKNFLLDNGRLQLEQIKQAFSLCTLEIVVDGEPCVTGCNIDGYIPVRFEPGTTVYISGKPAPT